MHTDWEAPEEMNCDRYRVDGRELVLLLQGNEIRRISFSSILGWCDTGQGTLSIVMKEGRSLDFSGMPRELEELLIKHFPDSFHEW